MALDVETDLQRRLLEGLLGEKHREAYQTNAAFHHHMEMLVRMLPLWVDGIATACEATEADRREAERLMQTTMPRFLVTPEELAEVLGQPPDSPAHGDTLTGQDKPDRPDDR